MNSRVLADTSFPGLRLTGLGHLGLIWPFTAFFHIKMLDGWGPSGSFQVEYVPSFLIFLSDSIFGARGDVPRSEPALSLSAISRGNHTQSFPSFPERERDDRRERCGDNGCVRGADGGARQARQECSTGAGEEEEGRDGGEGHAAVRRPYMSVQGASR